VREALVWVEQSALGEFMRTSSLWTYPIVNLLHVFGIAALFGSALVIDLRFLGLWRRVPLRAVTDVGLPIAVSGLFLALTTGPALLATQATEYIGNPFLLIKFAAIAVGLANAAAVRASPAWRVRGKRDLLPGERRHLAIVGGVSLASWVAAIAAGRLIAYW
jgi:hypothetical protein